MILGLTSAIEITSVSSIMNVRQTNKQVTIPCLMIGPLPWHAHRAKSKTEMEVGVQEMSLPRIRAWISQLSCFHDSYSSCLPRTLDDAALPHCTRIDLST